MSEAIDESEAISETLSGEEESDTICVYCSSSQHIDERYFPVAQILGRTLAARGYRLVYGGGTSGLMGALAQAAREEGGHVCGVIPERLQALEGVARDTADELIVTETMQQRRAEMFRRADAFAVLPGGFGTLEEFMEVLTLKQLGYHGKALTVVNTGGFYDALLSFFDQLHAERFTRKERGTLFHVTDEPGAAVAYIESYVSPLAREA